MTEWLSTREVAERLGYSIDHVRKVLAAKGVTPRKHSVNAHARWWWPDVLEAFHAEQNHSESQRNPAEPEIPH